MRTSRTLKTAVIASAMVLSTAVVATAGEGAPRAKDSTSRAAGVASVSTGVLVDGDGYLLGGAAEGAFVSPRVAAAAVRAGAVYDVYRASAARTAATGGAVQRPDEVCPSTFSVRLTPQVRDRVAATSRWTRLPRSVRVVTPDSSTRAGVQRLLRAYGITTPAAIKQVVAVDLDGNGRREMVVRAERMLLSNGNVTPSARAGDYSLVAVFRSGRLVKTLDANYFRKAVQFGAPQVKNIAAVADFNRDARFEVAVSSRYYEGSGTTLFSATRTGLKPVLATACGV